MTTDLTPDMITDDLKASVRAWLLAKAHSDLMTQEVSQIAHRVLITDIELYNDQDVKHERAERKRITDKNDTWLTLDETEFKRYIKVMDNETRKAGLKPDDMPLEHCPALVAEHQLIECNWLVLDCAQKMLGIKGDFKNDLLCLGLEKYHGFIDLCVGLVVNLPDFEKPELIK